MNLPPKTSVALCTFNGEKHIAEQLASIARQTILPSELIICDDGSRDQTISVIQNFIRNSTFRIILEINTETLGPARNFEKALSLCGGDIIFLCDQDDVWFPEKIANFLNEFAGHPDASYAYCNGELMDETGKSDKQSLWEEVGLNCDTESISGLAQIRALLKGNYITGAAMAIRASLRDVALPLGNGWLHDYWLGLTGSSISYGISIPTKLFKYRRHSGQVCGLRKVSYWQACLRSLQSRPPDLKRKLLEFQEILRWVHETKFAVNSLSEISNLMEDKERHLSMRVNIRESHIFSRCAKVVREMFSGRYQRFCSNPFASISRDFL